METRRINCDKWKFQVAGDIGGFGLESDFTAKADVGVLYTINKRFNLDLRYKATWVDYENGTPGTPSYFKYDTVTHCPLIGLNFKF